MTKEKNLENLSCTDCNLYNCKDRSKQFPGFCLTTKDNEEHSIADDIEEIKHYFARR